jgi:tagatose-1,6-bisphosphate aldolase non-catalytic subunit AgaZ/GatZ
MFIYNWFIKIKKRLLFVVGQVGTTMRIDMENEFNPDKTLELVDILSDRNQFLKVHYTDWLEDEELARFPELGVGAANVGPEFAAAVVRGLEELEEIEKGAVEDEAAGRSNMMEVLEKATIEDAPWKKFAPGQLDNLDELEAFARRNRRDIALCVGRYVLTRSDVVDAQQTLYSNLREHSSINDPNQYVVDTVQDSVNRYVQAFD